MGKGTRRIEGRMMVWIIFCILIACIVSLSVS